MLSAYEFARHFYLKLANHPLTPAGHKAQQQNPSAYHAGLTKAGANKVGRGVKNLIASVDYQICEEGGNGWFALGQGEHVQRYRHDWVVVARKRPHVPVIYGAQSSDSLVYQGDCFVAYPYWGGGEGLRNFRVIAFCGLSVS